ncbi:hypothetical protein RHSIM_Rhsim11G0006800 [Rhododendron simsii]|uniref:Uncharacterized protein n=1 Tax=Rhododendron simsii TaxID=118357 RepID=A0A834G8W0_RHOSS|nr:hypothetical protein RHSIM_Rhsim11G0006800 [Rhododendron simsii]
MLQQHAEAGTSRGQEAIEDDSDVRVVELLVSNEEEWVYKELDAAKIIRENEKLWRHCEGAKAALEEAQVALAKARDAVAVVEAVVEERRLVYECMEEEARLGDRLIDVPLCDADPFLKKVFG